MPARVCKAIAFTGNADLVGIGVVISYYIEASLTTLYLLVFTAWRIKRFVREQRQGRRRRCAGALAVEQSKVTQNPRGQGRGRERGRLARAGHRCFDALRGSLDGFLMAAGVLAIAILVAALVVEAFHTNERRRHPVNSQNVPSGHVLYDSALGLLVGLFAVFPPVVLYALLLQEDEWPRLHHHHHHHRKGRRTWLRRAVLVVLWALAAAVVFLDPPSELDFAYQGRVANSDDNFAAVLYACDQRGGLAYWQALEALKYLVIGVPVLWLAMTLGVYVLTGWRPWRPWRAARGRGRADEDGRLEKQAASEEIESKDGRAVGEEKETKIGRPAGDDQRSLLARIGRSVWRHMVAWLACLIMWTLLLYLTELRHNIVDVTDGLDMENKWAIGQVLAIATWGPVAVDFGFLLIFGIEAGLGSRLPLDFAIRQVGSTSSVDSAAEEDEDETGAAAAAAAAAAAQARGSSPDRANANSVHNRRRSASSAICRQTSSSTAETVGNDKTSVVGKCDCGEPVAPLALSMSSASSSAPSLLLRAQS
ncbi:hypothetical protein HMPREF1624_02918 [Sporothrix schenckii ATCC 58251]|uniref:Uncharacterized protein n=1 Tax=Sporothrix schenckii (strain ATCC 58251 / de Perez 2211183) TaxID=1391915 RepID=U7Q4M6_SPOS1|nr:hypothetical protein HMPREF1624_02918 [Sporothrix schenckii ATCC 58251]